VNVVLAPLAMDAAIGEGDLEAAVAIGRTSFEAPGSARNAYATTRAVQLADVLLDLEDARAAEEYVAYAEANAIPGDVLVRFGALATRGRLQARSGDFEAAEASARSAVAIAELTDAVRDRSRAHLALAEVLHLAGRGSEAAAEQRLAIELLEAKGARSLLAFTATRIASAHAGGEPVELPSRRTASTT
jgi:hypothetical protein